MGTRFYVPKSGNRYQKQSVLPPDLEDKRSQALWAGEYKKLINQDKGNGQSFPLKHLQLILVTSPSISLIGTK